MEPFFQIWQRLSKNGLSIYMWSNVVLLCSGPVWLSLGFIFSITQPFFTIGADELSIDAYPGLIACLVSWLMISMAWVVAPISWMAVGSTYGQKRAVTLLLILTTLMAGLLVGPMACLDLTSIRSGDSESRIKGPLITQSFRTTDICEVRFRSAPLGYRGMTRYELKFDLAKPEMNYLFHLIPFTGDGEARFIYTPTVGSEGFDQAAEELQRYFEARGFRFSGADKSIRAAAPDGRCRPESSPGDRSLLPGIDIES
ncbi:MAG: hypothetical protein NXI24_24600 [bacterium]|nr:hypothetical protein [bacterium]